MGVRFVRLRCLIARLVKAKKYTSIGIVARARMTDTILIADEQMLKVHQWRESDATGGSS